MARGQPLLPETDKVHRAEYMLVFLGWPWEVKSF